MSKQSPILPAREEIPLLASRPGSVIWRYASDSRVGMLAGYALLLQVAHPTVAAGVIQHSNFKVDPWGRLFRTLDFLFTLTYGRPEEAAELGQRMRELHKRIRGVTGDGKRYHALEPEPYAWVHATLAQTFIEGHRLFGRSMSAETAQEFWTEWRALGRLMGIREQDLPAEWTGFLAYFDRMVAERLQDNTVVQDVIANFSRPSVPPIPGIAPLWSIVRIPPSKLSVLATSGALPAALRARFGLRWGMRQELEFDALKLACRSATPLMPSTLQCVGPLYMRMRRLAIALLPSR